MEFESIVERNCADAHRHLEEAKRLGGEDRVATAYAEFQRSLEDARKASPEIYARYVQYK